LLDLSIVMVIVLFKWFYLPRVFPHVS
jgi:hypothetical protein